MFSGVDLSGASFWAVLQGAKFDDCNLEAVSFGNVNLAGSTYTDVNLSNAKFENINLSGGSFRYLTMENVEISDANLIGMKINGVLVSDLFAAYEKQTNNG